MPNYTKLFNTIITSTIWGADDKTRIVWITMLALADQHGEVHSTIPGLARLAGVEIEACEAAIAVFLQPDKFSRTPDNEGRRIAEIPGGWELLNHAKYRQMASKEDSKSSNAARQKRFRERNASVTPRNASVTGSNAGVTQARDIAEAEAKADRISTRFRKPSIDEVMAYGATLNPPFTRAAEFVDHYESNGWKISGKSAMKDWQAAVRNWNRREQPKASPFPSYGPSKQRGLHDY